MTTVAYSVTERLDTVLLSTLVSPATAAPYNVASRLALLVGVALAPVGAVLAPMLAQLLARGDRTGLQRALSQAVFLSTALAICFAAALLMFAPFLLGLFGKGFSGDSTVFFVLVAGQVVLAMVGPAGYLLAIAGHNRLLIAASLSAAALDVLLCLVLIPRFGPLGASLSTAVSIAANGIVLATISWRQVKVDTTLVSAFRLLSQRKVGLA
jgi:O-antigen/teichoic acid export membrane protein